MRLEYERSWETDLHSHDCSLAFEGSAPVVLYGRIQGLAGMPLLGPSKSSYLSTPSKEIQGIVTSLAMGFSMSA